MAGGYNVEFVRPPAEVAGHGPYSDTCRRCLLEYLHTNRLHFFLSYLFLTWPFFFYTYISCPYLAIIKFYLIAPPHINWRQNYLKPVAQPTLKKKKKKESILDGKHNAAIVSHFPPPRGVGMATGDVWVVNPLSLCCYNFLQVSFFFSLQFILQR